MTDTATGIKSVFGYDRNGNRIIEGYYRIGSAGSYQNAYITYDALNRVSEIRDANADIKYAYDANGNRRRVETAYVNVDRLGAMTYLASDSATGSPLVKEDAWYKYDSMNRFTLVKGRLDNGAIVKGTTGIDITYNARGDRTSTTHGIDGHVETYAYTADGYLQTVTTGGVLGAQRTTDVLGRLTGYTEYKANGTTVLSTRSLTYDADSRVTFETSQIHNDNGTSYTNEITKSYSDEISGRVLDVVSAYSLLHLLQDSGMRRATVARPDAMGSLPDMASGRRCGRYPPPWGRRLSILYLTSAPALCGRFSCAGKDEKKRLSEDSRFPLRPAGGYV